MPKIIISDNIINMLLYTGRPAVPEHSAGHQEYCGVGGQLYSGLCRPVDHREGRMGKGCLVFVVLP